VRKLGLLLWSEGKEGDAQREVELEDNRAAGQEGGDKTENNAKDTPNNAEDERDQRTDTDARDELV
jgi:hypothetical protein